MFKSKKKAAKVTEATTLDTIQQNEEAKRRQIVELSRKDVEKEYRKEFWRTFLRLENFLIIVISGGVGFGYLWLTTASVIPSLIMATISSVLFAFYFAFLPHKLNIQQQDLTTLEQYCIDISFHMNSGKTVPQTLGILAGSYQGRVGADINYTYNKLKNTGELDFSNFLKYEFVPLNIFHNNMMIAYKEGGDLKRLFKKPLADMSTELVGRDDLYTKNKFQRIQEYMAIAIGLTIPAMLRLMVSDMYSKFTDIELLAVSVMGFCFFISLFLTFRIQKRSLDIAVRV